MLSTGTCGFFSLLERNMTSLPLKLVNSQSAALHLRPRYIIRYFCCYETGEFPVKEWLMRKIEERITHDWFVTQHDPLGSFYYATWFHKTKYLAKLLKEREESVKLSYHKLVDEGFVVDESQLKRTNK